MIYIRYLLTTRVLIKFDTFDFNEIYLIYFTVVCGICDANSVLKDYHLKIGKLSTFFSSRYQILYAQYKVFFIRSIVSVFFISCFRPFYSQIVL